MLNVDSQNGSEILLYVTVKVGSLLGITLNIKKCKYIVDNKEEGVQLILAGEVLEKQLNIFIQRYRSQRPT